MLYDCFGGDMALTAAYATSNSASTQTTITIDDYYFTLEKTDENHDTIEIFLGNTAEIPSGYELRFTIFPIKNPASLY